MKAIGTIGAAALLVGLAPASAHAADGCKAHDAQTAAIQPDLDAAFKLMQARDIPGATKMLPKLEALLAGVPAGVPAPETCGADVLVYDHHQFLRYEALRKAGKTVPGYAKGATFVEKALNFHTLAYAVGWLHYENNDFAKALAAYAKGLAIAPGDHDLANEYVATLLNQKDYAAVLAYVDPLLGADSDIPAPQRASLLGGKAIAQAIRGNTSGAKATLAQAQQLDPANESLKDLAAQLAQ